MTEPTMRKMLRGAVISFALLGGAATGFAQVSAFGANEVRSASVKDHLNLVKAALRDGSESARRHSTAITSIFRYTPDWAPAAEAYYARRTDLIARAAALEARLDSAIARNSQERANETAKELDAICNTDATLRSDFELYMKLPYLGSGPVQRRAAQAAMRLLAQTGSYPVTLAYYLDRTPNRVPFAPLPPGIMAIRHQ